MPTVASTHLITMPERFNWCCTIHAWTKKSTQ